MPKLRAVAASAASRTWAVATSQIAPSADTLTPEGRLSATYTSRFVFDWESVIVVARKRKSRSRSNYVPDQAEIFRLCREIQTQWSDEEKRRRAGYRVRGKWQLPLVEAPGNWKFVSYRI